MGLTWDPDKAAANRVKNGLSFETATLVFDDPLHASKPDPHPVGRIISARKATARERRAYEEGNL